jgi:hypothetical protein
MYFNVFIVYFNIFQCTCSTFMVYFNIFTVHLNVFIAYLNVFECTYSIFMVYFNLFIIYFNILESIWVYLNLFECTYSIFMVYFNVFECIYQHCNWISPSHSHCNVFAMHTHLHIYFSLYTMTPFPTCYTTTFLFFHAHWSIPTFIQFILIFTSIHHPTFHIPCRHWLLRA